MKKKVIGFIVLCLLILIVTPNLTKAAESPVGLLDGVAISTSTSITNIKGSTAAVTDNNESTYFTLITERSDSTVVDTLVYTFNSPLTISAYKMLIPNYNNAPVSIVFMDANGNELSGSIGGIIPADNGIYNLSIPVPNVKKVYVCQRGTISLNIAEFNLYSAPSATPEPTPTATVEPTATPEPTIEPTPTVTPSPTPEQPTGDRAILVVTMNTGLEKEFDLSMEEVNSFITWYENKQGGTGTASFAINKHDNNKGPFTSRKDYVIFDKILTFSVDEYSAK
ncbi:hypothetical protein [Paenibacillus graminis]|uniref:hypothetical protein n=1 Tax=Paenibacillus graminis TaxID=189425 RepID=UPI000470FC45|nr:hypothetical protein [Paenibacillus graminis]